jgi:F0F1-type ATP synthase assembly protein I
MSDIEPRKKASDVNYARYMGIGFAFLSSLLFAAAVGFLVDHLVGTLPLFLLLGLAAGFAGGLYYVYRVLKDLDST